MVRLITVFVLIALLLCDAHAQPSTASALSHACRTLYTSDWTTDDGPQARHAQARRERSARNLLSSLPKARRSVLLHALLTQSHPRSLSYTSVAYVLADEGDEVVRNLCRMALAVSARDAETMLNLPPKLEEVYRRHPSRQALLVLLDVQGDGEVAEQLAFVRGGLFLDHPQYVLQTAARSRNILSNLADDLAFEVVGDDANQRAAVVQHKLHILRRSPDKTLSHAASVCLTRITRAPR